MWRFLRGGGLLISLRPRRSCLARAQRNDEHRRICELLVQRVEEREAFPRQRPRVGVPQDFYKVFCETRQHAVVSRLPRRLRQFGDACSLVVPVHGPMLSR